MVEFKCLGLLGNIWPSHSDSAVMASMPEVGVGRVVDI